MIHGSEDEPKFMKISSWETPATKYPLTRRGRVRLKRKPYPRGFYNMEGVRGYDYFTVKKPIPITSLIVDRQTWMVDDPLHWYGMQDLANAAMGRVLVAGLGLGLVIHALEANEAVTAIDVVEIDEDVIGLITPLIKMKKTRIINIDFWRYLYKTEENYDTFILDIWVYDEADRTQVGYSMLSALGSVSTKFPSAKIYIWGIRDPKWNPAVTKAPCYLETERRIGELLEAEGNGE